MAALGVGLLIVSPVWIGAQHATRPASPVPRTTSLAVVRSITKTPLPRGERISVEFSDEISYTADRVPNPDRVYFDFKNSTVTTVLIASTRALAAGSVVA